MRGKGGAASGENREWGCESGVLELYHVELDKLEVFLSVINR